MREVHRVARGRERLLPGRELSYGPLSRSKPAQDRLPAPHASSPVGTDASSRSMRWNCASPAPARSIHPIQSQLPPRRAPPRHTAHHYGVAPRSQPRSARARPSRPL